nr:transcription factor PCL1-like [Ipomoea batatas]
MEMGSVSVNQQVQEENVANIPDSMVTPKSKLVWTPELHSIFMRVVINLGGIEKATPKKILNAMNVPGLTRPNVSSHLQKVRGFMKSGGHKRSNRLARNHQHFIQSQLDYIEPPAAALSNTNSSHHASYKREDDFVPNNSDLLAPAGDLSFIFETEGVASDNNDDYSSYPYPENEFFPGLSPIWNDFGNNTTGQEMPSFSAYASNQETEVLTQVKHLIKAQIS